MNVTHERTHQTMLLAAKVIALLSGHMTLWKDSRVLGAQVVRCKECQREWARVHGRAAPGVQVAQ